MASRGSRYIDARGSNITDIGRDQINATIVHQTIHVHLCPPCSGQALNNIIPSTPPQIIPAPTNHGETNSACNIDVRLIIEIVQSLMNGLVGEPSGCYRALKLELNSLHQTLILAGLAIQAHEYTPLGRTLGSVIIPEVEQCHVVLQELCDKIKSYQHGFNSMRINCRALRSGDEISSLRMKLSAHQRALGVCLKALTS